MQEQDPQQAALGAFLQELPDRPGVYRYFNQEGELIYVGKAKNLRKRVNSYFSKQHTDRKTRSLVKHIVQIKYTLVDSEFDALLLENNLIKTHQPKYNINLKDDKSYPFLCLTKERFPRLFPTRRPEFRKHEHFGPYASVNLMNDILELTRELFTLRTCKLDLSEGKVAEGKYKVCLEYHIFNCKGPCQDLQTEADYMEEIKRVRSILKGNLRPAKEYFKTMMEHYAKTMEFEKAQKAKEKLAKLENYQSKSLIINPSLKDLLVVGLTQTEKYYFANKMRLENGYITSTENHQFKKLALQNEGDVLNRILANELEKNKAVKEIITNIELEEAYEDFVTTVPKIGDKRKLLQLSIKNAMTFRQDQTMKAEKNSKSNWRIRPLVSLQQELKLKDLPRHIECFDNSNLQGSHPVASMVCFKNGAPCKADYRKYNIKTVVGPDDFASMTEVVGRRYKRLIEEGEDLPQLVIVDGGKGQLSAAVEGLKEVGAYGKVAVVGIAKRLEEIYFPEDPIPLHIDKKSESLRLIQKLRNEAHRFAITFHRQKRSKSATKSSLEEVPGIGAKTIEKLRKEHKSLKRIKALSLEELAASIGKAKAELLHEHLEANEE